LACLGLLSLSAWAADGARVDLDSASMAGKADEVVEVNLEGRSLEQGSKLLAIRRGVSSSVKGLLNGLKGIYRRTYRFGRDKPYEDAELQELHQKMASGGWAALIDVKDHNKREAVTVYSYADGERVGGVTVVSSGPSEVTVVNIVGDVDLEALSELGEQFGVPSMRIATTELDKLKTPLPPAPKR
jgi:hypothetical protein